MLDPENAVFGMTGSFRGPTIARRYLNISRRFGSEEAASLRSNLSTDSEIIANETTPLQTERKTPPNADEKVAVPVASPQKNESSEAPVDISAAEWKNFRDMWIGKPISLLLLFAPFGYLSHALNWSPTAIFWLNFLTMVPLASILGDFTEEVAIHSGDVIAALVGASFGNAIEIIMTINLVLSNQIRVVQSTLIGSIYSNMLLVLGMCFLFGGIVCGKEQTFSSRNATSSMSLLVLSSIALILPTPFADYWDVEDATVLAVSRVSAIFLLISYVQLLYFQFTQDEEEQDGDSDGGDNESEVEEAVVPLWMALLGLGTTTAAVALFSEYLTDSIEGFCAASGLSQTFTGLIILPVVGNAVEHMTAVKVAMKDKMDLAISVAFGSATQMALFVAPFAVLLGWYADKPMTLNFPMYEIALYVLSMFAISVCISLGKSNWLLGSVLMTTYVMLAIGFWFEKVNENY